MDADRIKPYKELPYPWTVIRIGEGTEDLFYGKNVLTGVETDAYPTYDRALTAIPK